MSGRRFRRRPGGVSPLGLQVVWCPKDRHGILGRRVARGLDQLREQIAVEHGWQIVAKEVMPDRVHLLVRVGRATDPRRWCGC
jgi:putative transposase